MGIYSASKHAIEGYADTLDHEIRRFGVRSILVEPSFTATGLRRREVAEPVEAVPAGTTVRAQLPPALPAGRMMDGERPIPSTAAARS
jgi:NAD(P)-dependent dehydrogenase (short-subunit alcohol dehydrogenase family)